MKKNNLYFLFIPISDKKKFLSLMVSAPDENAAREVIKKEMLTLFPGDQSVSDEEIINFHELNYPGDVLAEVLKLDSQGRLVGGAWIAIMQGGQTYALDGCKDREQVEKEFKKQLGNEYPNLKFTGDLYSFVGEQCVVLLRVDFTDEFLNTTQFGKLGPDLNTTYH